MFAFGGRFHYGISEFSIDKFREKALLRWDNLIPTRGCWGYNDDILLRM